MGNLQAHISVNKNRVKEYGDNVYLRGGTHFEIELFNGSYDVYGALIEMNGKPISNKKVILKPGERVFLERYLDSSDKFVFNTYSIDANDKKATDAIRNNGLVVVKYFKEVTHSTGISSTGISSTGISSTGTFGNFPRSITYTGTGVFNGGNIVYGSSVGSNYSNLDKISFYASPTSTTPFYVSEPATFNIRSSKETGRVGKGDRSNQAVTSENVEFEQYPSYRCQFKILPESSRMSYSSGDIRTYCSNCGTRYKKGWKFCATCGKRI